MTDTNLGLEVLEPRAKAVILELQEFALCQFDVLDSNKDGFLSREELLKALYDQERTARELAFLNFLLVRAREISLSHRDEAEPGPGCISRRDLQEYFARLLSETAEVK